MNFTEDYYTVIVVALIIIAVLVAILLSGRLKISLSDSHLSIASEKNAKTHIKGVTSSIIEVHKKAGDDTSIEDVRDNSNIKIK